jgi:integrase
MATEVKLVLRNSDRLGRATVYAQYSHLGKSKWWKCAVKVKPSAWDEEKQKVTKAAGDGYKTMNTLCQGVKNRLNNIITDYFHLHKQAPSLAYVDKFYSQPVEEKTEAAVSILSYLEDYLSGKDISEGTKEATRNMCNMVGRFEKVLGEPLTWSYFNLSGLQAFANWMIEQSYANNTTVNQISLLKTYLGHFAARGLHDNRAYQDFKLGKRIRENKKDALVLSWEEYKAVLNAPLPNKELEWCRDAFCFSCATGLRWSDCSRVNPEMIKGGILRIKTQKTGQDLEIPLNADAKAILKRWGGTLLRDGKATDYQWMRERMKTVFRTIAKQRIPVTRVDDESGEEVQYDLLCNEVVTTKQRGRTTDSKKRPLYKALTFHKSRSTFVCICLEKLWPEHAIRSITGHTDLDSFTAYINSAQAKRRCMASWAE